MTNLSNARGTIAANAFLDDLIFHDTDEFIPVNDLTAVNGMDAASNLFNDRLLPFISAHTPVKDPMFANTIPVANHSVMYAHSPFVQQHKSKKKEKNTNPSYLSLYSHHHLLVIDVHTLVNAPMCVIVASHLLEKPHCLGTKDAMMRGKSSKVKEQHTHITCVCACVCVIKADLPHLV